MSDSNIDINNLYSDEENGDVDDLRDTTENLNGVSSDSASTFEYIEKQWSFSERDNISPIEAIDHDDVQVTSRPCASTKEEKQRQNEEIAVMDSVSASSESWESVPIRHNEVEDAKESCRLFLRNERCFGVGIDDESMPVRSSSSSTKPCFIDASSLLDEEDLIYTPPPSVCHKTYNAVNQAQLQKSFDLEDGDDQLQPKPYDIKDQYSALEKPSKMSAKLSHDESGSSRENDEKHQGNLIFKHAIPQFSGHLIKHTSEDNYTSDLSIYSSTSGEPNDFANSSSHFNSLGENTSGRNSDGYNSGYSHIHSDNDSSIVLPETPFNSIVQVARQLKIYETGDDVDGDEKVEQNSTSYPIKIPKRSMRYDEFAPVLSGGASVKDFTPKQYESPNLKRRTDTCPIVSGGSVDIEEDVKPKETRRPSTSSLSSHSWVVDFNELKIREDDDKTDRQPKSLDYSSSSNNAFGFYVDFNSLTNIEKPSYEPKPKTKPKVEEKRPTGFYVDFSDSSRPETPKHQQQQQVPSAKSKATVSDKKNIFSMFIDFNDEEKKVKTDDKVVIDKKVQESPPKVDESPKPCYMFIESDSPIVKRRANVISKNDSKRHSWNVNPQEGPTEAQRSAKTYQRSTSVSNERGMMNILEKIPILSKTSSMSIDSSVSPYEDFSCSKSFSSYSNNSATTSNSSIDQSSTRIPLDENLMTQSSKKRRKDAKLNETFDKSSQGSVTEGILSNDTDDTSTDTDDVTFQNNEQEELQCQELRKELSTSDFKSKIMETIPETTESSPLKKLSIKKDDEKETELKIETHTMESLQALIEKQKQILENAIEPTSVSFVKLSDLDKPPPPQAHFEISSMTNSTGARVSRLFHENNGHRSLTLQYESRHVNSSNSNNTWNMSRSTGNNLTNLASSLENSRSLSRLFPHLSKGKICENF
jgi:BTB/POZ domain-containing protein 8